MLVVASCKNYKSTDKTPRHEPPLKPYDIHLIVGTYTQKGSAGIYVYDFDSSSGRSRFSSVTETNNPSYLAVSKDSKYIYAISEEDDIYTSSISAYTFNVRNGHLTFLNKEKSGGSSPCYVAIDDSAKHVVVANYGGTMAAFDLYPDGAIYSPKKLFDYTGNGPDTERQSHPHIHCTVYSPDYKYVFATDLGTDRIYKYKVDKEDSKAYLFKDEPVYISTDPGEGPRHLVFHPNGKYAYLVTELGGNVIVYDYKDGNLVEKQKIKIDPTGAKGSGDIQISPDGKFLYASNRLKNDGIAICKINKNGTLKEVAYQNTGIHPRNFIITENGQFLLCANRDSNSIQVFKRDLKTGLLTDTKQDIEVSMPVCLKFAGKE